MAVLKEDVDWMFFTFAFGSVSVASIFLRGGAANPSPNLPFLSGLRTGCQPTSRPTGRVYSFGSSGENDRGAALMQLVKGMVATGNHELVMFLEN